MPPVLLLSSAPRHRLSFSQAHTHAHPRLAAGEGEKLIPMEIYLNEFPAWTLKLFPAWRGQGSWRGGRGDRLGTPAPPYPHVSRGYSLPQAVVPAVLSHRPRFGLTSCLGAPRGSLVWPPDQSRERTTVAPAAPRRRSGGAAKPAAFCPISSWAWPVCLGKEKFAERFHR